MNCDRLRNTQSPPRSSAGVALVLAGVLALIQPRRLAGEDRVEWRYENYAEDRGRIGVETHGWYAEKELTSKITAHAQLVYDSISGATPRGGVDPLTGDVPVQHMEDERLAGSVDTAIRYGRHTTTPQVAYSHEGDYESVGLSLNHAIDFNQRNTTLILGLARNFDRVGGGFVTGRESKGTWDGLIGINQLLGPKTSLTVNLTLGYADGFLTDPYKGVFFSYVYPDPSLITSDLVAERRPQHRFKQVGYLSLTQYLDPLHASVEGSYRFHNDDFGVQAHTVGLTWFQKLGKHLVLSPMVRYHRQTAADFYAAHFVGDPKYAGLQFAFQDGLFVAAQGDEGFPTDPTGYEIITVPQPPSYYSADYRLSEMETWTYGAGLHWKPLDWLSFDFAYKRYEMAGLDGLTPASVYPRAHVFTVGLGIWF